MQSPFDETGDKWLLYKRSNLQQSCPNNGVLSIINDSERTKSLNSPWKKKSAIWCDLWCPYNTEQSKYQNQRHQAHLEVESTWEMEEKVAREQLGMFNGGGDKREAGSNWW